MTDIQILIPKLTDYPDVDSRCDYQNFLVNVKESVTDQETFLCASFEMHREITVLSQHLSSCVIFVFSISNCMEAQTNYF